MPEAVTSFGAVGHEGWLYVFGGHQGKRHDYSAATVSGSFHRLDLSKGANWESLPDAVPGQGQPLVAHAGLIYRIGGMAARNTPEEEQDLFSWDVAQRFNPASMQWESLPDLPEPRSSHDAVVLGDRLYVAGGWGLDGETEEAVWYEHGLVLDLSDVASGWRKFSQPFQRRALATAALGTKVLCLGGMDPDSRTSLAVDIYDVETKQWSEGPELPPGRHRGFACTAIAQDGAIYVSMFQGDLLRLSPDMGSWQVVGRLENPRIAHRLVAAGNGRLIALGGEDGRSKRPDLEWLSPEEVAFAPSDDKDLQVQSSIRR